MISNLVSVIISRFIIWHSVLLVAMPLLTGHHNHWYSRSKTRIERFIFCITFCQSVFNSKYFIHENAEEFRVDLQIKDSGGLMSKTIEVEPAGKASFLHFCIQTRLLGQYKGNWPFSLAYESRPLITALQLFLVAFFLLSTNSD